MEMFGLATSGRASVSPHICHLSMVYRPASAPIVLSLCSHVSLSTTESIIAPTALHLDVKLERSTHMSSRRFEVCLLMTSRDHVPKILNCYL